ncbi:MAG: acetyl-CoA C-acyltransferase [Granulosicoccaceae bacterium]
MSVDPIVIVGAKRTPMGGFQGDLANCTASELGSVAIRSALEQAGLAGDQVDEVIMGCVLPAGQGQAPARQAALGADLDLSTTCTTVNKMCGSGMRAAMSACDTLSALSAEVVVAGGMESMSNAPYLMQKARSGLRMGHDKILDHMFLDGLEDAYEKGKLMGSFADGCASQYKFSRETQDEFALRSLARANNAIASGAFKDEIAPVATKAGRQSVIIDTDEQPGKARPDKIPQLKPAFNAEGTVTAANASSISDGSAALVLMRESTSNKLGIKPLARILGHCSHAQKPSEFAIAPIAAIEKLLKKTGTKVSDYDLFEVNEAFAVVALAATQELGLDPEKVNVNGGACALGHPIGASGARILTTLLYALKNTGKTRGIASLCIGGGEATAMAIEMTA